MSKKGEKGADEMSKLGQLCDRFIEAGWLVALALVPLYIPGWTFRGFEVGKADLLRTIVLLMVVAWVVTLLEGRAEQGFRKILAPLWKNPLAVPVLAYTIVFLLTTATSVAPGLSVLGAFVRSQGTYTTLSYIALFCLVLLNLKTREQLDRIVSVLLLVSIPIALYAVAQEWRLEPLRYLGAEVELKWPVRSTMGQHIFLGAYLVMLIPWTLARLIDAAGQQRQGGSSGATGAWRWLALGAGSLLVQNMALAAFLVSSAASRQVWWLALPVLTAYAFLVIWTTRLGTGGAAPIAMVSAYAGLLLLQALALAFTQARGPWLATLVGAVVFGVLVALRRKRRRLLVGVIGSAVVAGLFIVVLNIPQGPLQSLKRYAIIDRLGSLSDFSARPIEMRLLVWRGVERLLMTRPNIGLSGDRLAEIRPLIGYGPETLALAIEKVLPLGLARQEKWHTAFDRAHNDFFNHVAENGLAGLGALLVLLWAFYRMTLKALWQREDAVHQLPLMALVGAMTGHLTELQFGVGITPTRMLFWVFLALGVCLARPLPAEAAQTPQERRSPWRSWMIPYTFLILFLVVVVGITTVQIRSILAGLLIGFSGILLGLVLLALDLGPLAGKERARWRNWWIYAITGGLAGLLIFQGSLRPQAADAFYRLGQEAAKGRRPLASVLAYQRAIALDPREDAYYFVLGGELARLGRTLLTQKPDLKPPQGFQATPLLARTLDPRQIAELGGDGALALAEAAFQEARLLQPLEPRYAYQLAGLNHAWGLLGRQERLDRALRYYQEAAEMSPNRARVLVDWGMAHLAQRQFPEALNRLQAAQSLGLDSWRIHYALALVYYQAGNTELALKEAETASREVPGGKGSRSFQELLEQLKRQAGPLPEKDAGNQPTEKEDS